MIASSAAAAAPPSHLERLFGRWCPPGSSVYLWSRWLFLRALGLIFLSAFYSLAFQIHGLIGARGILPAGDFLRSLARAYPGQRYWLAPTLLWLGAGDRALTALVAAGLLASALLVLHPLPRARPAVGAAALPFLLPPAHGLSSFPSDRLL